MALDPQSAVNAQNAQIGQAYGTLGQNLQNNVTQTGNAFNAANQGVNSAYQGGISSLQDITGGLTNRLASAANSMGIGGTNAYSQLQGNLAANQQDLANREATAASVLNAQKAAYEGIAQKAVGDAAQQGELAKTTSANKLNQAMYGLQGQEAQAQGKVDMQRLSDQANIQRAQMANQSAQLQDALKLRQAEVAQQSAQNAQQYKMQLMQAQSGSPLNQLKYENALATLQGKTNALNRPPVSGMGMGAVDQFMQQNNITPESPEYLTFQALMGQTDPSKSIDQNYQQLLQSEPTEGQNQLNLITSKEYPAMQGQGGVAIHPEVSGYAGTNSNGEMPTISDPTVQQMLGLFYGKSKNTR